MYISYPPGYHTHGRKPKAGILHLTDVLGLPLADSPVSRISPLFRRARNQQN